LTDNSTQPSDRAGMRRQGLVTVFTGNGKGKTTAAIGTAVRAAGYGHRVFIVFFLKGKMFTQGEVQALAKFPNVETASFGTSAWVIKGTADPEASSQSAKALESARNALASGKYDLVILDEINGALDFGLVTLEDVIDLIASRPPNVDLILTGRGADPAVIEAADVVTEMVNVKHAFERGVPAREGFDY
jgi:cob(I)alamin adenosyltransferase